MDTNSWHNFLNRTGLKGDQKSYLLNACCTNLMTFETTQIHNRFEHMLSVKYFLGGRQTVLLAALPKSGLLALRIPFSVQAITYKNKFGSKKT